MTTTPPPNPTVSSVTWSQARKRQLKGEYTSDEDRAEATVNVPLGGTTQAAIDLAKAIVAKMLGEDPYDQGYTRAARFDERMGPQGASTKSAAQQQNTAPSLAGNAPPTSYSRCKFCGNEIKWGKRQDGRPLPLNVDGSNHACRRG